MENLEKAMAALEEQVAAVVAEITARHGLPVHQFTVLWAKDCLDMRLWFKPGFYREFAALDELECGSELVKDLWPYRNYLHALVQQPQPTRCP